MMLAMKRSQAGFTLLEIMAVVAIIGILVAIALPSWASRTRKSKGDTEIGAVFAELRLREEQYQLEKGNYLTTGATEADMFPATTPVAQSRLPGTLPATWTALKIRLPLEKLLCTYTVVTGLRSTGTVGGIGASFGFTVPAKNWFYIVARCNLDGVSSTDSYYFTSSTDATIRKINHGK